MNLNEKRILQAGLIFLAANLVSCSHWDAGESILATISLSPTPTMEALIPIEPTPSRMRTETLSPTEPYLQNEQPDIELIRDPTKGLVPNDEIIVASWSADGKSIIYGAVPGFGLLPYRWVTINLATLEEQFIEHPVFASELSPIPPRAYPELEGLESPSGNYAIQIENDGTDDAPIAKYWLVNLKTGNREALILETDLSIFRKATWVKDETYVLIGIGTEFGTELHYFDIARLEGQSLEKIIGYSDPGMLDWSISRDGAHIAIVDSNGRLNVFSLNENGHARYSGFFQNIRWAPAGQEIFYSKGEDWYISEMVAMLDIVTWQENEILSYEDLNQIGVRGYFEVSPGADKLIFWNPKEIWLVDSVMTSNPR